MRQIIFLLEELSMKVFLDGYLPRLMPGLNFLCIKHEGKQDLEKSIPRKLRAFQNALFVVLRDNHGADCFAIKARLQLLCKVGGRSDALVRIVCQELEAWYLGSPQALASVYHHSQLRDLARKAKYRNPDRLGSPSSEIVKLTSAFRKMDGARRMAAAMPLQASANSSPSFRVFVEGVLRISQNSTD